MDDGPALAARYYDPQTAAFLATDPLEAITGTPYSYANDNPLNVIDPSGMCWFCLSAVTGVLKTGSLVAGVGPTILDSVGLPEVGLALGEVAAASQLGAAGIESSKAKAHAPAILRPAH